MSSIKIDTHKAKVSGKTDGGRPYSAEDLLARVTLDTPAGQNIILLDFIEATGLKAQINKTVTRLKQSISQKKVAEVVSLLTAERETKIAIFKSIQEVVVDSGLLIVGNPTHSFGSYNGEEATTLFGTIRVIKGQNKEWLLFVYISSTIMKFKLGHLLESRDAYPYGLEVRLEDPKGLRKATDWLMVNLDHRGGAGPAQ